MKKQICDIDKRIANDDTEKIERGRKEDEYDMTSCARTVDSSNTEFLVCFCMFLYVRNLGFKQLSLQVGRF